MWASPVHASVLTVPIVTAIDYQEIWIDKLSVCESGASTTIKILDTNNYYSYGLLMFQMKTWLSYGKPFGATKENIYDEQLQRKVARSMLDAGGQGHWYHCSNRIGNYPVASSATRNI